MSIIALDIHPQCKFSCFAANDKQCVHHPHEIVPELNHQSTFADKRVLVESQPENHLDDFCSSFFQRHDTPHFLQETDSHFGQYVQHCQSNGLLSGLPNPADYDYSIETDSILHGACFHDTCEHVSNGLVQWLHSHHTHTIIVGGLTTEHAVRKTVEQLCRIKTWQVIVNLGACRGYTPKSTLNAIYSMRAAGAHVVADASALPQILAGSPFAARRTA